MHIISKPLKKPILVARLENLHLVEEFKTFYQDQDIMISIVRQDLLEKGVKVANCEDLHKAALWLDVPMRAVKFKNHYEPEKKKGPIELALEKQRLAKIAEREAEEALSSLRFEVTRENELYIIDGPDGVPIRAPKEVWHQWLATAPRHLRESIGPAKV